MNTCPDTLPAPGELDARFPLLLRRGQAVALCQQLGGSERTLRKMIASQTVAKHQIPGGTQFRYKRDDIIAEFTKSLPPSLPS